VLSFNINGTSEQLETTNENPSFVCGRTQNVQYYAHRFALLYRDVCIETLTAHFDRQLVTRTGRTRVTLCSHHHFAVISRKPNTNCRILMPFIPCIVFCSAIY